MLAATRRSIQARCSGVRHTSASRPLPATAPPPVGSSGGAAASAESFWTRNADVAAKRRIPHRGRIKSDHLRVAMKQS